MLKIIFALLVVLHGLIHLIGFARAFNMAKVGQFNRYISRPIGLLWLFAALLFIFTVVILLTAGEWWWLPALLSVLISQVLIVLYWQDAKFGTIPNLIILVAILIGYSIWNFNLQVSREIETMLADTSAGNRIITSEIISDLPVPVQKWLNYSGVVGKEEIHNVHLKQVGVMRLNPEQKNWVNSEAEQSFNTVEPESVWRVNTSMFGLPVVGRDYFGGGAGEMLIKLAGIIPVVNVSDHPKLSESTMQRYLGEIVWFPTAAAGPYITWEAIDDYSARATMDYSGTRGSAIFYFDVKGEPVRFVAQRYRDIDAAVPTEWVATIKGVESVNGIKIPVKIEASWMLEEGEFVWYIFEVRDVRYNK